MWRLWSILPATAVGSTASDAPRQLRLPPVESGAVGSATLGQRTPAPAPVIPAATATAAEEEKKKSSEGTVLSRASRTNGSWNNLMDLFRAPPTAAATGASTEHTPNRAAANASAAGAAHPIVPAEQLETYLHTNFPSIFPNQRDIDAADAAAPPLPDNAWLMVERYKTGDRPTAFNSRMRAAGVAALSGGFVYGVTELLSGSAKRVSYRMMLSGVGAAVGVWTWAMRDFLSYDKKLDSVYRSSQGEDICTALRFATDMERAAIKPVVTPPPPPPGSWRSHVPSFFPFSIINPPPPKPPQYSTPRLSLATRWQLGGPFLFMSHARQQQFCDSCDRYRARVLSDAREQDATRAKCRALHLDAETETLVMYGLQKKHELRVWIHVDRFGPEHKPWTWRWLAANYST